jgi:isocitrate dehydrogenase kinase/phosphatase
VLRPGSGAPDGALRRAQEQIEHAVVEYGNAIKDLVAANIFPGDMLWKNFGITRHGKVVFYDYDEIEYITDCNFRRVPAPRNEEDEMSGEIWYSVGPKDVFPETFGPFLLGNPRVREVFMQHHADLLDVAFWQSHKARIREGHVLRCVSLRTSTSAFARCPPTPSMTRASHLIWKAFPGLMAVSARTLIARS